MSAGEFYGPARDVEHGDPALDPPLSIRVHPDDDSRDPAARRVVRGGAGAWVQVTGELATVAMLGWVTTDEVASWPRQHWLVAATVFRHAAHADRPAAELDGSDVAATPFRMGELEFLRISLDDGPELSATLSATQWSRGRYLTYATITLDGAVGEFGRKHAAKFTVQGQSYRGTAEVESRSESPNGSAQTTLVVHDVEEVE